MAGNELTLKDIQSILEIIKSAEDIQEFSLKFGGAEIQISRGGGASRATQVSQPRPDESGPGEPVHSSAPAPPPPDGRASPVRKAKDYGPNAIFVKANMVGTFYRSPAPDEPPFVEVGQRVEANQVLCILEVMKLMNSISAPSVGTVAEILVENGDPVEFGQTLMIIIGEDLACPIK